MLYLCILFLYLDQEFRINTPDSVYDPKYIVLTNLAKTISSHQFITFKVKACHDAYIGLIAGDTVTSQLYEIVIGAFGNTKSVIRTAQQQIPAARTVSGGQFVHCQLYKQFWISWTYSTIKIGKGMSRNNLMFITLSKRNGLNPINNIAIYTGFGSTGEWVFYKAGIV